MHRLNSNIQACAPHKNSSANLESQMAGHKFKTTHPANSECPQHQSNSSDRDPKLMKICTLSKERSNQFIYK